MDSFDDGVFIDLVRHYTILYDKGHKGHKDKLAQENAWASIASAMKATGTFSKYLIPFMLCLVL